MKASHHGNWKKFRRIALFLICFFFLTNTSFSQFGTVLKPNGKNLTIFSPGRVTQSCILYGNPPLPWFIWIDGEHRGTIPGGAASVDIALRRGEYGKTLSVQGGVFGKDCTTRSQIVLRNQSLGEVTIPYHQSLAGNTSITANNLPEQACDFRIASWDRVPSPSEVEGYLYNSPASSFAVPKDNTEYTFSFNTGNRTFSKIRYYTGAVGKEEGNVQTFNNPGSSISFSYRPNSVYLNKNSNYTRLLILECYNASNQVAQLVAIPIIVTGTQTVFAKDANGNYLTTKGPPTPSMVLHNTPGDNSFSYIAESTSTCSEVSMGFASGNNQDASVTVTVGTDVSVFGVNVESEFSVTGSYSRSVNEGRESSTEVCRTITKTVENQNSFVGEDGDLFIGNYTTYRYGPSVKITYDGNCSVTASNKNLNLVAVEMEDFAYVKADIESDIIPRVTQQRNQYAQGSREWREFDRNITAWNDMIRQNSDNIRNTPAFSGTKIFKGDRGALGAEESVERTSSYAMSSSLIIDASLLVEAGVSVGGSGISGSVEVGISKEVSRGNSSSQTNAQAIGYSLQDDDGDDEFRLKVKKDLKFGTHIFELQNDSRSSCPYEGGYQLNQPELYALDNGTEKKEINIYATPGTAAQIPLRIKNGNTISGLSNTYRLSGGNLANAVVELGANGIGLNNQNKDYDLGSNESISLVNGSGQDLLYVKQNSNSNALSYEGIEILLTPTCDEELEDIFDKVILNVYFENQFSVSPGNQTIAASAGSKTFQVTSSTAWSVSSSATWLTINPSSGNGNGSFTASYTANPNTEQRSTTITARTSDGITRSITVTQEAGEFTCNNWVEIAGEGDALDLDREEFIRYGGGGQFEVKKVAPGTLCNNGTFGDPAPGVPKKCYKCEAVYLDVTPTSKIVSATSGSLSLDVSSNVNWEASSDASWLTITPANGSGNGQITLDYNENEGEERTANILISTGSLAISIPILQEAIEFTCDNWVEIAGEGDALDLDGEEFIRYGGDGQFEVKKVAPGTLCNNATFGDPAPGVPKKCYQCGQDAYLNISLSDNVIAAAGGSATLNISSNVDWSVSSNVNWIRFSTSSGNGDATTTVSGDANDQTTTRVANISVSDGTTIKTIQILQEAGSSYLEVSEPNKRISAGFGGWSIFVTSNVNWSATTDANWLSLSTNQGDGDGRIFVEYTNNTTSTERRASIVLSSSTLTVVVNVIQEAGASSCGDTDSDQDGLGDDCDNCPNQANTGLSFDGQNDYVSVGSLDNFNPNANTIEMWLYLEARPVNVRSWPLFLGTWGNGQHWIIGTDGQAHIGAFGRASSQIKPMLTTGEWTHLAAVYTGSTYTLYINGETYATINASFSYPNTQLVLGGLGFGDEHHNGKMDEVRIWNTARSQGEIEAFMYEELSGNEASLAAYYNFNQGTINANNTSETVLKDNGPNGYDGTMKNFALNGSSSNWTIGAAVNHYDGNGNGIGDICEGTSPSCNLQSANLIVGACNDNGTSDPSDDYYDFSLQPTGTDLSSSYHILYNGSYFTTNVTYAQRIAFPRQPIAGGTRTMTIIDSDDATCSINITIVPPAVCSEGGGGGNSVSFCDDFDNYSNGAITPQSTRWMKWAGESEDADVTSSISSDGGKSLKIEHEALLSDQTDVLLKLGDLNAGDYDLSWNMYVQNGKSAYFNLQKFQNNPGSETAFQITFDPQGIATLRVGDNNARFTYPRGQWFTVKLRYKFAENEVVLYVNNTGLFRWAISSKVSSSGTIKQLGAIDFYAIENALYFIDEFCINQTGNLNDEIEGRTDIPVVPISNNVAMVVKPAAQIDGNLALGQNQPNPVRDITNIPVEIPLNIQDAYLEIVDLNGKVVNRMNIEERGINTIRLEVDLAAGIYFYSLVADGKLVDTKKMVLTH